MRRVIIYPIISLALLFAISCENVLEQDPVDSISEEAIFTDMNLLEAYLQRCYDYIGGDENYLLGMREDLLASATDECLCIHRPSGYTFVKGTLTPDEMGHFGNWRFNWIQWDYMYSNIKNVNVLLANIDDVPIETSSDEELIAQYKAEGYFIRAFVYTNLLRSYGGLALISDPFELDDDFLSVERSSIEATMDFILEDIENAIAGLPEKDGIDQGRATKGAAAALKSRLLSFCAGELTNGGYESSNELVSFQGSQRTELLTKAKNAAKAIMDGDYGSYALTGSTNDPPSEMTDADVEEYADNYYNLFIQKGEWDDEVIWGIQYLQASGSTVNTNKWNGPNGYHNWGNNNPTEPAVRRFEMADGSEFVWDKYDSGNETTRDFSAAELEEDPERNPFVGREPRFYATVLYNGAGWQARPTDMAASDPYNQIQSGYYVSNSDTTAGIDTRQTDIEAWNGTKTGYYMKKLMDINTEGQYYNTEHAWLEFRYAEVVLDYAEACIELGGDDLQNGLDALNTVRNRAGLPDRVTTDQEQAREWYRHERQIEFYGEGDRWYMIRKWMIADEVIENISPMKIYQNDDGSIKWYYDTSTTQDARTWNESAYWLPLSRDEMNKAPQLQQNPGYN
ncbi:RagB/SusD family nutrient uptake outer membrane protein [Maribellus comscasis]|nr:RagB/SusD family nutrient uptake outer membrane protein [Maribellus comscasis]